VAVSGCHDQHGGIIMACIYQSLLIIFSSREVYSMKKVFELCLANIFTLSEI